MAAEVGHTESGQGCGVLERGVDPGQLVFDADVAHAESFDFAEPTFSSGLDDVGFEVVADLFQPSALSVVRP
ncbi:hypothetical protein ABTW96_32785 [Nocardia beijingensis]|uniref:hypothetical protein n=1 Tax=Nocardia beijingensis TaxID=95162 RepID=UPI0033222DBB